MKIWRPVIARLKFRLSWVTFNTPARLTSNFFRSLLFFVLVLTTTFCGAESPTALKQELQKFIKKIPAQSALVLVNLADGHVLFSHNPELGLKPASVLKLLTTRAALKLLGPEFSFETKIAGTEIVAGQAKTVTIKGGGDPTFRIEELILLIRRLRLLGISGIEELLLDDSSFIDTEKRTGMRAYEAGASALAFNFNSLRIQVCPTQTGKSALVVADPFEYPVKFTGSIKTVAGVGRQYQVDEAGANTYQLKGSIGSNHDCADHYRSVPDPLNYLAQVLARQLAENRIKVGKITRGVLLPKPAWGFSMNSRNLVALVTDLNHYSSNFLAEQILFALGTTADGQFSRKKGLAAIADTLQVSPNNIALVDGSGLSHENRVPARLFIAALEDFWKDQDLRVEFERSLAVLGRSGTLKSRPQVSGLVVRAKTGSLNGVSSVAGYVYSSGTGPLALVMIQNGSLNRAKFIALENELLRILANKL